MDAKTTEAMLHKQLCEHVWLVEREAGVLMLDTPFSFSDGDHFSIYITETSTGGVKLSDGGHTFMHLSYHDEVDSFRKGARGELLRQILLETGLRELDGEVFIESTMDELAESVVRLGQGLTKIDGLSLFGKQ